MAEHSIFREDPWRRLRESLDPVLETVYAADGAEVGARIREAHRAIRGTNASGRRYSAWEPEAYWFVLASGMESAVVMGPLPSLMPYNSAASVSSSNLFVDSNLLRMVVLPCI